MQKGNASSPSRDGQRRGLRTVGSTPVHHRDDDGRWRELRRGWVRFRANRMALVASAVLVVLSLVSVLASPIYPENIIGMHLHYMGVMIRQEAEPDSDVIRGFGLDGAPIRPTDPDSKRFWKTFEQWRIIAHWRQQRACCTARHYQHLRRKGD